MNKIISIFAFFVGLLTLLLIGCSDKKEESQNQQQTEKHVSFEEARNRLRVKHLEEVQNQPQVETPERKSEKMKEVDKDSVLARNILSANECSRACLIDQLRKDGDSSVFLYNTIYKKGDCEKYCNAFENIIPVNACNRACLTAGDEFIQRTNYIMDSLYFSRYVLEICDETCPCASSFDSVAYKKSIGLILDSLMQKDIIDSVVYAKSNEAVRRLNRCHKTRGKGIERCRKKLYEYRMNRLKKLKDCGLQ